MSVSPGSTVYCHPQGRKFFPIGNFSYFAQTSATRARWRRTRRSTSTRSGSSTPWLAQPAPRSPLHRARPSPPPQSPHSHPDPGACWRSQRGRALRLEQHRSGSLRPLPGEAGLDLRECGGKVRERKSASAIPNRYSARSGSRSMSPRYRVMAPSTSPAARLEQRETALNTSIVGRQRNSLFSCRCASAGFPFAVATPALPRRQSTSFGETLRQ